MLFAIQSVFNIFSNKSQWINIKTGDLEGTPPLNTVFSGGQADM